MGNTRRDLEKGKTPRLSRKKTPIPEGISIPEYLTRIDRLAVGVLPHGLTDPRFYNCIKAAINYLTGRGILLRAGQSQPAQQNTTIYNQVLILQSMSEPEKEKMLADFSKGLLAGTVERVGLDRSDAADASEDQGIPSLVAAEIHKNS